MKIKEICEYGKKSKIKAGEGLSEGNVKFFTSSSESNKFVKEEQFTNPGIIMGTGGNATLHYCDEPFSVSTDCIVLFPKIKVSPKYLYYFFKGNFHVLQSGFKGAGLKHTSKKYIDEISLNHIPSNDEQVQIVNILDNVNDIIVKKNQQLQEYDQLIKSRFVEIFGLPGKDNKGWGLKPLGECCELNPKKAHDKRLVSGLDVSFVPMQAVSENGHINSSEVRSYDEVRTGFTYFTENDVLFAKITPCMENGKGAVAVGLCNNIGFGSTEFHVLRPVFDITDSHWLYTLTSFKEFRIDAANNMTGSAGQRRVPATFLDKYKVSLPPIELQQQFASFVKQIDKLKFEDDS